MKNGFNKHEHASSFCLNDNIPSHAGLMSSELQSGLNLCTKIKSAGPVSFVSTFIRGPETLKLQDCQPVSSVPVLLLGAAAPHRVLLMPPSFCLLCLVPLQFTQRVRGSHSLFGSAVNCFCQLR